MSSLPQQIKGYKEDLVEQLEKALARCRDAMPEQADKAIDALMIEAIASPCAVPAYVEAVVVRLQRENAELRYATLRLEEKKYFNNRIEALERSSQLKELNYQQAVDELSKVRRENALLEKRLKEVQHMCLGYQQEHAELLKSLIGWDEFARKSGLVL
jgi:hypothetical protein